MSRDGKPITSDQIKKVSKVESFLDSTAKKKEDVVVVVGCCFSPAGD